MYANISIIIYYSRILVYFYSLSSGERKGRSPNQCFALEELNHKFYIIICFVKLRQKKQIEIRYAKFMEINYLKYDNEFLLISMSFYKFPFLYFIGLYIKNIKNIKILRFKISIAKHWGCKTTTLN